MPLGLVQLMPYDIKRVSDYTLPDALGNCDGDETRNEPACSTEEGTMEEEDEEGSSGGPNVALGQHSTAGRYQHYINTEQDLKKKEEEYICNPELLAVGVVCKSVKRGNHVESVSTAMTPHVMESAPHCFIALHVMHVQRVSLIRDTQLCHLLLNSTQ